MVLFFILTFSLISHRFFAFSHKSRQMAPISSLLLSFLLIVPALTAPVRPNARVVSTHYTAVPKISNADLTRREAKAEAASSARALNNAAFALAQANAAMAAKLAKEGAVADFNKKVAKKAGDNAKGYIRR